VHIPVYVHYYRYAEEHPDAGVLYRGFAIRVWQDPTASTSSSSSTSNSVGNSSTGSWRADVFLNFYPKFDNAKEAEASDLIQVIIHYFEAFQRFQLDNRSSTRVSIRSSSKQYQLQE
jgi:hypothetical protein